LVRTPGGHQPPDGDKNSKPAPATDHKPEFTRLWFIDWVEPQEVSGPLTGIKIRSLPPQPKKDRSPKLRFFDWAEPQEELSVPFAVCQANVSGWFHDQFLSEEPEILRIAGTLVVKVYEVLDLLKPEPGLLKFYDQFHITRSGSLQVRVIHFRG